MWSASRRVWTTAAIFTASVLFASFVQAQSYSLPVTAANLSSVKDYFKATFIYKGAPGSTGPGGVLNVDQILYRP